MPGSDRASTLSRALAFVRAILAFEHLPPPPGKQRRRPLALVQWIFEGERLPEPAAGARKPLALLRWIFSRETLPSPPAAPHRLRGPMTFFSWLLSHERLDDPRKPKETRDGRR